MSENPNEAWADLETASADYATRFAGPVGQWFLATQTRGLRKLLPEKASHSILDVGGGHGQSAGPLREDGNRVTVQGSHPECEKRLIKLYGENAFPFVQSSPITLPFPDESFDWVVCLRLLTHTDKSRDLIREMSRVAKKGIIIDYPNTQSLNAIGPVFFRWKKSLEKNTRHWRQFKHREVVQLFDHSRWEITGRFNQFFFPMAFHRLCKILPLTQFLEGTARLIGLTALLGNPTLLRAERKLSIDG